MPPRKLISEQLHNAPKAVHALLNTENAGRNIRHIRHQNNKEPANPKTLSELIIPEEHCRLKSSENILKCDIWLAADGRVVAAGGRPVAAAGGRTAAVAAAGGSTVAAAGGRTAASRCFEESDPEDGDDDNENSRRILIFSTDHLLDLLRDSKEWGCDATISIVPLLFDQLWCLHIRLAHTFIPVVYCLMSGRTEALYSEVLNALKRLRPDIAPASISSDFEKAELNAFVKSFPGVISY
jgi:hypothetical protein